MTIYTVLLFLYTSLAFVRIGQLHKEHDRIKERMDELDAELRIEILKLCSRITNCILERKP